MEDSQEKDYSFLGNDTFPNLYDALVYERKFKSEYLERQIYERSLCLQSINVGGAGDCFVRSVSHQLYGNSNHHMHIRTAGVQQPREFY